MYASLQKHQALIKQVFAFACVGVTATVTHYAVALLVIEQLGFISYVGNVFGYCAAVGVSLFGHSIFTFKRRVDGLIAKRFVVVSLSTLAASELILAVLENVFLLDHRVALLGVVLSIPVVTFFLTKFWVYAAPGDT